MTILDVLLVILGAIGLSHIVADSSIAAMFKYWLVYRQTEDGAVRRYDYVEGEEVKTTRFGKVIDKIVEMMNCHQCNGFWSGLTSFGLYYVGCPLLLWGFVISLLSPLWAVIYVILANHTVYEGEGDDEEEV